MNEYNLTEKIYSSWNDDFLILESFMEEVVDRRKMNEEGGLQAAIVVLKDKVGAKVCDHEGIDSHQHSIINMIRFLNGKKDFLSPRNMSHYPLYLEEQRELIQDGLEVRIISNLEEMQFIVFAYDGNSLNRYQKEAIHYMIELLKKIQDRGIYQEVSFGISTEDFSSEFECLTNEKVEEVENYLNSTKLK